MADGNEPADPADEKNDLIPVATDISKSRESNPQASSLLGFVSNTVDQVIESDDVLAEGLKAVASSSRSITAADAT